jgi:hypothetical protein
MTVSSVLCAFTKASVNMYFPHRASTKNILYPIFIAFLCRKHKFSSLTSLALFYSAVFLFFLHMSSQYYLHKTHVFRLPAAKLTKSGVTPSSCTTCDHAIVLIGKFCALLLEQGGGDNYSALQLVGPSTAGI